MGKSRVLVVGGTGFLGRHVTKGSLKEGHPTFILVRPSSDPAKKALVAEFENSGATALYGELEDHGSLVAALKQVDIVISVVRGPAVLDGQLKLVEAIKEVGHIKRFLPAEYGTDVDRFPPNESDPAVEAIYAPYRVIRKAVKEAGIPYTFVHCGGFASLMWAALAQLDVIMSAGIEGRADLKPPREKVTVLGSGEGKMVAVAEEDIGVLSVKAADDPRALNKKLVIRPNYTTIPFNSVVEIWEKKIGHSLHKTYLSDAEVKKQAQEVGFPADFLVILFHYLMSGADVYPLSPTEDVDADELFPDYKCKTPDEYLEKYV